MWAAFNLASSGTLIPKVPQHRIRVRAIFFVGAATITFTSNSKTLVGPLEIPSGFALNYNPEGWFTGENDSSIALTIDAAVAGVVVYDIERI
jgi:hypothetical protein